MKALTIRNLPSEVAHAIQKRADEARTSLSQALISLLEDQIAGRRGRKKKRRDLSYIAGSWTNEEYQTFMEGLAQQRKIDPEPVPC